MKKLSILALLLMVLLFTNCYLGLLNPYNNENEKAVWRLKVIEYELKDEIQSHIPGYVWRTDEENEKLLVIHIEITNLKDSSNWFSLSGSAFEFAINNRSYILKLQHENVPGYISTSYEPYQKKNGFIIFLVDEKLNISTGQLEFIPHDGCLIKKSMASVPEKK